MTPLEKQRLGLTVMPGSSQDSNEDESIVFTNGLELRPQLLYTKFQRLKNTTKLARVVVINEHPCPKMPIQQETRDTTIKTMDNKNNTTLTNFRDSGIEADPKIGSTDPASLLDSGIGKPTTKQSFNSNMPNNR